MYYRGMFFLFFLLLFYVGFVLSEIETITRQFLVSTTVLYILLYHTSASASDPNGNL